MNRAQAVPIFLSSLLLVAAAASNSLAATFQVTVGNFVFTPANFTVTEGDTVNWVWSSGTHTVTSGVPCTPDGLFDAPVNSSSTLFVHVFNHGTGTFDYFCRFHCGMGMTGTVTVTASTGVKDNDAGTESALSLSAFPNPATRDARLLLRLPAAAPVRVMIRDVAGRQVATVADGWMSGGDHDLSWNGRAEDGLEAPSGMYFARVETPRASAQMRLLLLQ